MTKDILEKKKLFSIAPRRDIVTAQKSETYAM